MYHNLKIRFSYIGCAYTWCVRICVCRLFGVRSIIISLQRYYRASNETCFFVGIFCFKVGVTKRTTVSWSIPLCRREIHICHTNIVRDMSFLLIIISSIYLSSARWYDFCTEKTKYKINRQFNHAFVPSHALCFHRFIAQSDPFFSCRHRMEKKNRLPKQLASLCWSDSHRAII